MFLPDAEHGAGPQQRRLRAARRDARAHATSPRRRATARRRTPATWRCCTSSAREEQKERWLRPLLDGEIRSGFAMTEPDVASSDATNIALRIERDGDEYVLNGRKWWIDRRACTRSCRIMIVMGKTRAGRARPRAADRWCSCRSTRPGVEVVRALPVFGYMDHEGHGEIASPTCACRQSNLIAGEGAGFLIAQARLGPGRIHHCMRCRRRGRACAGADVQARRRARDVRQSRSRRARTSGTGSPRRASRSRCAAAHAEDRVADGHRRRQARAHRDRRDQGGGARTSR